VELESNTSRFMFLDLRAFSYEILKLNWHRAVCTSIKGVCANCVLLGGKPFLMPELFSTLLPYCKLFSYQ